jgi:HEAT repeat protein
MNKDELLERLRDLKRGALDLREQAKLAKEIASASSDLRLELIRMLEQETEPSFSVELLTIIGVTQDEFYADAILDVLRSAESPEVRQTAATSLGKIRSPKSFAALVNLLDDPSLNVRLGAVYGLQALGDQRAVEHLLMKLQDNEPVSCWWTSPKAGGYKVGKEAAIAIDALSGEAFKGNTAKIQEWLKGQQGARPGDADYT